MKLSERINELFKKEMSYRDNGNDITNLDDKYIAILLCLDEEKVRVNEVLHEIVGAMHDGAFDTQNCNYLHQMIEEKLKE